jgi:hypothetical protein
VAQRDMTSITLWVTLIRTRRCPLPSTAIACVCVFVHTYVHVCAAALYVCVFVHMYLCVIMHLLVCVSVCLGWCERVSACVVPAPLLYACVVRVSVCVCKRVCASCLLLYCTPVSYVSVCAWAGVRK